MRNFDIKSEETEFGKRVIFGGFFDMDDLIRLEQDMGLKVLTNATPKSASEFLFILSELFRRLEELELRIQKAAFYN